MKEIKRKIFEENPTFVLMLGLCPALAVTTKFESAMMMGLCVLVILIFSNVTVSLLRKFIDDSIKIPCYILIIGTFVTIIELLLKSYIPALYEALGIYLPLIVVNCIVLGRALSVASKSTVKESFIDALGIGLGFLFALMILGFLREVLGNNTLTIMDRMSSLTGYRAVYSIPLNEIFKISILTQPAGAFLVLGFLLALIKWRKEKKHESK